jgi:poly-beta-1,6-N-acetyl-D-glucosamine synthase
VKFVFWISLGFIFFAYAGYPILVFIRARLWPRPVRNAPIFPNVTILIAVHNEEKYLSAKLQNLATLDYPADKIEIIVVSDGSTDKTNQILSGKYSQNLRSIILDQHKGKATALNAGVAQATGVIIVFTDARQSIAPEALKNLIENFADPSVGCASGELMIGQNVETPSADGVGLYWRIEKNIREWEGLSGSSVGATGAFYAVRKNLICPLPEETILDDVYIPLHVTRLGQRVVFEPNALAFDPFIPDSKQEFRRKLRTLFGNYQLLELAPWVLSGSNPLRFQFICHKLIRLLVPIALITALASSAWIHQGIYNLALVAQLGFYALALLSLLRPQISFISKLSNIALGFVVLNSAAFVAFLCFVTGRRAAWTRT